MTTLLDPKSPDPPARPSLGAGSPAALPSPGCGLGANVPADGLREPRRRKSVTGPLETWGAADAMPGGPPLEAPRSDGRGGGDVAAEGPRSSRRPTPRPSVLVVDDDRLVRTMVVDILQSHGLACRTASSGTEALEACESAAPDVILLDVLMPVMDGIETCRRLKATPASASIPVIALTTRDDPQTVVRMLAAGSLFYLTKPVSPERLLAAIRLTLPAANLS